MFTFVGPDANAICSDISSEEHGQDGAVRVGVDDTGAMIVMRRMWRVQGTSRGFRGTSSVDSSVPCAGR